MTMCVRSPSSANISWITVCAAVCTGSMPTTHHKVTNGAHCSSVLCRTDAVPKPPGAFLPSPKKATHTRPSARRRWTGSMHARIRSTSRWTVSPVCAMCRLACWTSITSSCNSTIRHTHGAMQPRPTSSTISRTPPAATSVSITPHFWVTSSAQAPCGIGSVVSWAESDGKVTLKHHLMAPSVWKTTSIPSPPDCQTPSASRATSGTPITAVRVPTYTSWLT